MKIIQDGSIFLQVFAWIVFWGCIILNFALLITVYAGGNMSGSFTYRNFTCDYSGATPVYYYGHKVNNDFQSELCDCREAAGLRRSLAVDVSYPVRNQTLN